MNSSFNIGNLKLYSWYSLLITFCLSLYFCFRSIASHKALEAASDLDGNSIVFIIRNMTVYCMTFIISIGVLGFARQKHTCYFWLGLAVFDFVGMVIGVSGAIHFWNSSTNPSDQTDKPSLKIIQQIEKEMVIMRLVQIFTNACMLASIYLRGKNCRQWLSTIV